MRVLEQLRACGVLDTIRISAAGFPSRFSYSEFNSKFGLLLPNLANSQAILKAIDTSYAVPELALTRDDVCWYDELWEHVQNANQLTAQVAVPFFRGSGLSQPELQTVWSLSNTREPSALLSKNEFRVACKLVSLAQEGEAISTQSLKVKTMKPFFGRGVPPRKGADAVLSGPRRASMGNRLGSCVDIARRESLKTKAILDAASLSKDGYRLGLTKVRLALLSLPNRTPAFVALQIGHRWLRRPLTPPPLARHAPSARLDHFQISKFLGVSQGRPGCLSRRTPAPQANQKRSGPSIADSRLGDAPSVQTETACCNSTSKALARLHRPQVFPPPPTTESSRQNSSKTPRARTTPAVPSNT